MVFEVLSGVSGGTWETGTERPYDAGGGLTRPIGMGLHWKAHPGPIVLAFVLLCWMLLPMRILDT